jgi:hypothetical protein
MSKRSKRPILKYEVQHSAMDSEIDFNSGANSSCNWNDKISNLGMDLRSSKLMGSGDTSSVIDMKVILKSTDQRVARASNKTDKGFFTGVNDRIQKKLMK